MTLGGAQKRLGVLALARSTFDVPFAQDAAARAFAALDAAAATEGVVLAGPRELLFDADAAAAGLDRILAEKAQALLILQATFTDAAATVAMAARFSGPLAVWAFPEPRAGGRLRLNAFCGLNLAAHALGRAGRRHASLYAEPSPEAAAEAIRAALTDARTPRALPELAVPVTDADRDAAARGLAALQGRSIGLIGEHPAGFDTCRFDDAAVAQLTGARVERIALSELFARGNAVAPERVAALRGERLAGVRGLETVDQPQLDRSLALYEALADLSAAPGRGGAHAALAVRCWPEMFTEHGCAACGPMGMLTEDGIPCACEADLYGALTATLAQGIAGAPAWLVDVVDADRDTAVLWHCGSAPESMRDETVPAQAQIHTNRRMPLLFQFTLKPGRATLIRLSQARGEPQLLVATGEMRRAPMAFTGTSGTFAPDGGAEAFRDALLEAGAEHHVAVAYGDHAGAVRALGERLGVPVRRLGA